MIDKELLIIASPSSPDNPGLSRLIDINTHIFPKLLVVTGNYYPEINNSKITINNVNQWQNNNIIFKILNYIKFQISATYYIIKKIEIENVIFHVGTALILPVLVARLFKKRVIILLTGSSCETIENTYPNNIILQKLVCNIEKITLSLTSGIVPFTRSTGLKLTENQRKKIWGYGAGFVNTNRFKHSKIINDRKNLVGYVGRLSAEKGIMIFLDAIPYIDRELDNIEFIIVGSGPLESIIQEKILDLELHNKIKFVNGVKNSEIPEYLNDIKLLVVPSYTEGLPQIVLEAMSCGTPVLANAVGNIPDVIKDGYSGFLMSNNTSDYVAISIIRALCDHNFTLISRNAINTINDCFTLESAVKRFKKIFSYKSQYVD